MNQVYYDSYPAVHNNMNYQELPTKEKDTEEVASFLLSLKHRSVTPEPNHLNDSGKSAAGKTAASHAYPAYSYQPGYMGAAHSSNEMPSYAVNAAQQMPSAPLSAHSSGAPVSSDIMASVESLVAESSLVCMKDRDLVPDALFVAMAQMKPCELTQADRVGCYKSRELGFLGMCCVHCGGQPGFGRYYPNSVRSLAQTTTSQTILKHIGGKCRFCPHHVRQAVLELQRQQAIREGAASGRPRYGSRKIFFQRVWARLHGQNGPMALTEGETDSFSKAAEVSGHSGVGLPESFDGEEEETSISSSSTPDMAEEDVTADMMPTKKRGSRFGALPTQKNKRSKVAAPPSVPEHLFTEAV